MHDKEEKAKPTGGKTGGKHPRVEQSMAPGKVSVQEVGQSEAKEEDCILATYGSVSMGMGSDGEPWSRDGGKWGMEFCGHY